MVPARAGEAPDGSTPAAPSPDQPDASGEPAGSKPAPARSDAPAGLAGNGAPRAASDPESHRYLLDRLAAGASVGYFRTDPSRILTEIHFDFPFLVIRRKSLYVRGTLQTSTVKTGTSIRIGSFEAQDIEYLVEAGARDYLNNRVAIAAFVGQQGREQLDQSGSRQVRYLGVGFESVGFPRPGGPSRFEWRLALGPAFQREGIEADAVLRGAFLFDIWRGGRSSVGLDGSFDSIFDHHQGQTEYRIGPQWTFPLSNGIRATLFSEWIRGRNPVGIAAQGWNFGVRYSEGAYSGPHTTNLPDVRGVLSFGRGSSRGLGRFDLDLSSPELHIASRPGRVFANLDATVVAGTGIDNLFYIATAGLEATIWPRVVVGPYVYHRSNHTIGQGSVAATSLNIVQISLRTPGWEYADRLPGRLTLGRDEKWWDHLEASLAPGLVTDSSFGRGESFDLQAGVRMDLLARSRRIVPYVRLFSEWGDVDRREASIGFSTRQNLVFEVRYRRDEQLFGHESRDTFLMASLYF